MISELKTFRDNFTHFRTRVVMTVEFYSFSCKIQPRHYIGITCRKKNETTSKFRTNENKNNLITN